MSHTITSTCTGCTACVKVCPTNAISGARNSLHVIDPKVCIDCGACGRICPVDCIQDEYGHPIASLKRSLWLQPIVEEARCVSCGVCLQVCPTGVLDFAELTDHQVHQVAYLRDPKHCIGCVFCEMQCPTDAIRMVTPEKAA